MNARRWFVVVLIGGIAAMIWAHRIRSKEPQDRVTKGREDVVALETVTPAVPDNVRQPGVVGTRLGPLRAYIAVAESIQRTKVGNNAVPGFRLERASFNAAGSLQSVDQVVEGGVIQPATMRWEDTLKAIPIDVVFENDTYEIVERGAVDPNGVLFNLTIADDSGTQLFSHSEPAAEVTHWLPAERRSFSISLPMDQVRAETVSIVVRLPNGSSLNVTTRVE